MAPFLTSRVSLLSLSDKSTGDVLGHAGDVRRGLRHWVFLFVELHVEGPHSAFYGWRTLVGWSGMRYMLLRPRLWGLKSLKWGPGALYVRGGGSCQNTERARFKIPSACPLNARALIGMPILLVLAYISSSTVVVEVKKFHLSHPPPSPWPVAAAPPLPIASAVTALAAVCCFAVEACQHRFRGSRRKLQGHL